MSSGSGSQPIAAINSESAGDQGTSVPLNSQRSPSENSLISPSETGSIKPYAVTGRIHGSRLSFRFDADSRRYRHFVGNHALNGGAVLFASLGGIWRRGSYESLWIDGAIVKALFAVSLDEAVVGKPVGFVTLLLHDDIHVAVPHCGELFCSTCARAWQDWKMP